MVHTATKLCVRCVNRTIGENSRIRVQVKEQLLKSSCPEGTRQRWRFPRIQATTAMYQRNSMPSVYYKYHCIQEIMERKPNAPDMNIALIERTVRHTLGAHCVCHLILATNKLIVLLTNSACILPPHVVCSPSAPATGASSLGDALSPLPKLLGKNVSDGSKMRVAKDREARSHSRSSNSSIPWAEDAYAICKHITPKKSTPGTELFKVTYKEGGRSTGVSRPDVMNIVTARSLGVGGGREGGIPHLYTVT